MKDFPEEGGNVKASTAGKTNKEKKNKYKTNPERQAYAMLIYKSIFSTFKILSS